MSDSTPQTDAAAPRRRTDSHRSIRRRLEAVFDRVGVRPLALLVFVASLAALAQLQVSSTTGALSARAVATAPPVEHTVATLGTVVEVHVEPGERVSAGMPLITVSTRSAGEELAVVERTIEAVTREAELEQLRLAQAHAEARTAIERELSDARRDASVSQSAATRGRAVARAAETRRTAVEARVEQRLTSSEVLPELDYDEAVDEAGASDARRVASAQAARADTLEETLEAWPEAHSLSDASARLYAARLEVLRAQADALRSQLDRAVVVASRDGIVTHVSARGASVSPQLSVATVVPETATEIVAYVDPSTPPQRVSLGGLVHITTPPGSCGGRTGRVRRLGTVAEAPPQIRSILDNPVHGLSVYVSVPDECALTVGQVLEVELGSP